jgi:hypothetical protein
MNKHVMLCVASAIAAALAGVPVLAATAVADASPLSDGCAAVHADEGGTSTAFSGQISVSGTFRAGEQVRFTVTGNDPVIAPTTPGGGGSLIPATSGVPIRYDVTADGPVQFVIGVTGGGPVSLSTACGIPPEATINAPTDGQNLRIGLFDAPTFSCADGTNPVATCSSDPARFDTTEGSHVFRVTATDEAGLSSTSSVGYTMSKREQVVTFADDVPTGVVWGQFPYFAQASSSVGLPVTISVDPASTGCTGQTAVSDPFVPISFPHPGTCIVHADQAGTVEYEAAHATQTFTVAKHKSYVATTKASKGLLGLTPTTFRASLDVDSFIGVGPVVTGLPDAKVVFAIAGKPMCTATTVIVVPSDNPFTTKVAATCKATIGLPNALRSSYTATFAGDDLYLPSTATGKLQ